MECVGLYFFIPVLMEFDGSIGDFAVSAFICLWLGVVFCGALISFYRYSKKVVIDDDGISYNSIFGKHHLDWNEIQDYGLSYDGRSQDGADFSNSYIIYFAKEPQKNKNPYKKKLSRNDMLTILFANALPALVEKKHLSEDDLSIVLRAIKLNPGIFGIAELR